LPLSLLQPLGRPTIPVVPRSGGLVVALPGVAIGFIMAGSAKQTRHYVLLKDQFGQTVLILPTGTTSTRFARKLGTSRVR
jgi:hypothetical protein